MAKRFKLPKELPKRTSQKETLPGIDIAGDSSAESDPKDNQTALQAADAQDLAELEKIPNAPDIAARHEEAHLEEVRRLGESALPVEVQIADAEDLRVLEAITDDELARIENMLANPDSRMSRRAAEIKVLGKERALRLRGEEPRPSTSKGKPLYNERGPYRPHPKRPSSRLRGIAEERSAEDPWLR